MDPKIKPGISDQLNKEKGCWIFADDLKEALYKADAVVILTEWPEYKESGGTCRKKR